MTNQQGGQPQQENQGDAITLPQAMTVPCRDFLVATMQVWAFMQDFAKLAQTQEEMITALAEDKNFRKAIGEDYRQYRESMGNPEGEPEEFDSEAFFQAVRDLAPRAEQVIGRHTRFLYQMLLSRAVDNFLLYLAELLILMYRTKLGGVGGKGTDIEAFIASLIEQYVEGASLGGMKRLPGEFENTFGIKLFAAHEKKKVERIIARRNSIVHHRGIVDRYFLRQVKDSGLKIGDPVPFEWSDVHADVAFLLNLVIAVDGRASEEFSLPRNSFPQ